MKKIKVFAFVLLIAIALISEFGLSSVMTNPDTYQHTMEKLDEKRTTVLELTTSATAASLALGAIPGDATTPIATKIIDMVGYLVIVLCTIVMEKYMLTLTGFVTFRLMIPIACALALIFLLTHWHVFHRLAIRIFVFGILLVAIVPSSVVVTELIETTYKESINATIEKAKDVKKDAEEETTEAEESTEAADSKTGILKQFQNIQDYASDIKKNLEDAISDKVDSVTTLTDDVIKEAEDMVNDFIETIVVMLVTSCVIPLLVLVFFLWIGKMLIGADMDWDKRKEERESFFKLSKKRKKADTEDITD